MGILDVPGVSLATVNSIVATSTPLPPARTPETAKAGVMDGDSLTESGVGTDSICDLLATLTGLPWFNNGKWGRSGPQTAAANGGAPASLTFPGNTIPTSGSVVVTASVNPLGGSYSGSMPGVTQGVAGTLTWDQPTNVLTWARTIPGAAVALTGPVKFAPASGSLTTNREAIHLFWIGRNGAQDVAGNTSAARAMAAYGNARFLVMEILPWVGNLDPAVSNYALRELFPDNFVPIASWLRTAEAAASVNLTFTPQDTDDIAAGMTPTSFRIDGVHLNLLGRKAVAAFLFAVMVARGWVAAYAAPTLPVAATNRWDATGRAASTPFAALAPLVGSVTLTQGTPANQPLAVVDAAFKRNVMQVGSPRQIGGALASTPTTGTITIIGRFTDATEANGKLFVNLFGILLRVVSGNLGSYSTSGGSAISTTTAINTLAHVYTLVLNGAASTLWVDGVKVGTGTTLPSNTQITIGGGAIFNVAEPIYNDSVLSDANILAQANALRAAYIV